MKIAIFQKRTHFHKNSGGLEIQSKELAEGLCKSGYEVHIISPKHELSENSREENSVSYHFIESEYRMGKFFGFGGESDKNNWFYKSNKYFEEIHNTEKFNLIISQNSAGLTVMKNRKKYGIKALCITHGSISSEFKTALLEYEFPNQLVKFIKDSAFVLKNFFGRQREMVHNADLVVSVSTFVKKALVEETFVSEEKIIVIPNGVNSPNVQIKSDFSAPLKLISVGRLEKSKGFHILLDAVSKLDLDFKLTIIGDGPYEAKLKEKAERLNLSGKVIFLGKIQRAEIYEQLSNAHIFIFPTLRYEGFPMVLVESLIMGIPVIGSNIGGVSDAIIDNFNGYLTKLNDVADLTKKIQKLNTDRELLKTFSANALQDANSKYTMNKMVQSYIEAIQKLI